MWEDLHDLKLPVKKRKADLSYESLQALQAAFERCNLLIIDEKSMVRQCPRAD